MTLSDVFQVISVTHFLIFWRLRSEYLWMDEATHLKFGSRESLASATYTEDILARAGVCAASRGLSVTAELLIYIVIKENPDKI